jgi:hypothetical protein
MPSTAKGPELTAVRPKRSAEAMARRVFPQLATKADLDKAVSDIAKNISELALRSVVTMIAVIAVAGLADGITKAL